MPLGHDDLIALLNISTHDFDERFVIETDLNGGRHGFAITQQPHFCLRILRVR
jgi:hypothetical protein